jgi:hypothetical protein
MSMQMLNAAIEALVLVCRHMGLASSFNKPWGLVNTLSKRLVIGKVSGFDGVCEAVVMHGLRY